MVQDALTDSVFAFMVKQYKQESCFMVCTKTEIPMLAPVVYNVHVLLCC